MRANQLLGIRVVRVVALGRPAPAYSLPASSSTTWKHESSAWPSIYSQLRALRGRQASNSCYRLRRSRRSQSAVREHAPARLSSMRRADAGISDRDRLRSTPRLQTGKRASEAFASTSVPAFELSRISSDVLSRVTDAASSGLIVDAPAKAGEARALSRRA